MNHEFIKKKMKKELFDVEFLTYKQINNQTTKQPNKK